MDRILQLLEQRAATHSLRQLSYSGSGIDFFSNDYLGLAQNREIWMSVHQRMIDTAPKIWNGSTGSRLLSGNHAFMEEMERYCAHFFKGDAALLFNSGYAANVGLLSSIPQKGDTILYDEYIHASLKEGARLSLAQRYGFKHNNLESLESKLKRATGTVFIVIEAVYSMDGDHPPLSEIIQLAKQYNAVLIVDEAHSTGVYGTYGEGWVVEQGWSNEVDIRIHTMGKAIGAHGACIIAAPKVIEYLINFARSFIYSTAMSPHSYFTIQVALEYLQQHTVLLQKLKTNIRLMQSTLCTYPGYIPSSSPIQILQLSGNKAVQALSGYLNQQGFDIKPILSPTVKEGQERIRSCIHAYNTEEEIQQFNTALINYV